MIRLRRLLERGRKHPVLGPLVLVLLVLLLALVWFHAAHDGWDGAAQVGAVCIALATVLTAVLRDRVLRRAPVLEAGRRFERGPPRAARAVPAGPPPAGGPELVLPLRR